MELVSQSDKSANRSLLGEGLLEVEPERARDDLGTTRSISRVVAGYGARRTDGLFENTWNSAARALRS